MSGFVVLKAGLQTSIQDLGRYNLANIGVCEAGVMDEKSSRIANLLVENDENDAVLEIALGGVWLKATATAYIALSGASSNAYINERKIEFYKTYKILKDETLKIDFATRGSRIYLSVKGGFDIDLSYNSRSTSIKEQIGGIDGRALRNGDFLPFKPCKFYERRTYKEVENFEEILTLRLVLGYQSDSFSDEEKHKFFSSIYKVTEQNNRMAYKLEGEIIQSKESSLISEPIAFGAVQIAQNPIVLLKERQSIGGYAKIGSVILVDCFKLAQRKAGNMVKFQQINQELAREICTQFYKNFNRR